MKDNLQIITDIKKTVIYLDKIVMNFPNNDKVIKDRIMTVAFDVLEMAYMANENKDDYRIGYQKRLLTKVKMIDFYLKLACDKNYISYQKYQKIGTYLLNSLKQIYGWIKSEKAG